MPQKSLEERVRDVEDRLEIINMVASHPPGADTGSDDFVATRGSRTESWIWAARPMKGRENIASIVRRPEHKAAIAGGICHFAGLPHIELNGDTAIVTSYLTIFVPQTEGSEITVPNHGSGKGFRPFRVGSNRWDLVRTADGWKIKHRVSRPLDGSEPARQLLRGRVWSDATGGKAG